MRKVDKSVLVHSCRIQQDLTLYENLVSGNLYICETDIKLPNQQWFRSLPASCNCVKRISEEKAKELKKTGQAVWILRFIKKKGIGKEEAVFDQIWRPIVRERVPRIDLISRADIERAYIGSDRKSKHFMFNKVNDKFEKITIPPEGMTKKEWEMDLLEEIKFEERITKHYRRYIEECHKIILTARAELIVPFRSDPFEGCPIFSFPDQRTKGGFKKA